MDRVFSAEELSDQFWSSPPAAAEAADPKMNRSHSEWAFQRFLQEAAASSVSNTNSSKSLAESDVAEIKDHYHDQNQNQSNQTSSLNQSTPTFVPGPPQSNSILSNATASFDPRSSVPVDSEDYQAFLKSRLNLACAAVALTRAPFVVAQGSAGVADTASSGSANSQPGFEVLCKGSPDKDAGGPIGIPALPAVQKKPVAQTKPATSSSSRDQSDDDEAEGENETTENMDPADVKRVRRMLSNRESARRSRRRKQAHLTELETQVSELKVENSSLLTRMTEVSQKCNEAAVDNRVLKADVETLRAKVKMAEETVKRVTGMNPLLQAMSEISTRMLPFSGIPSDATDAAVPVHNDPKQHFYQPGPSNRIPSPAPRIENGVADISSVENVLQTPVAGGNKMGRTASMERVASLEHLQKRICRGITPRGTQGSREQ